MKKILRHSGVFLIILGTLTLIATRFGSLASHNGLLLAGLAAIVAGIVVHIRSIKADGPY